MRKHEPSMEWTIVDEGAAEQTMPTLVTHKPATPRHKLYRTAVAGLFVLLLLAGRWLVQRSQRNLAQVESELQSASAAAVWAAAHGESELVVAMVADPLALDWREQFRHEAVVLAAGGSELSETSVDLDLIDWRDNRAVVQAGVGVGSRNYRQTRFYRLTADGWRQTAPAAAWWGSPARLESTYFIFVYREKDAQVVAEVAPRADAIYAKMRRDVGLPLSSPEEKPVVEIRPTERPGAALLRSDPPGRFVVPSPAIYLAPTEVTDAELVLQSLLLLLSTRLVDDIAAYYDTRWVHEDLLSALRLWTLWETDLPLAAWREEILHWRMEDWQDASAGSEAHLPSHYAEFCAQHAIWIPTPTLLSIPLSCSKLDHAVALAPRAGPPTALELEQRFLSIIRQPPDYATPFQQDGSPLAVIDLASFLEYVVHAYGRDRVPELLAALAERQDVDALSQSVFGIPPDELAAGWHAYLVARSDLGGDYAADRR